MSCELINRVASKNTSASGENVSDRYKTLGISNWLDRLNQKMTSLKKKVAHPIEVQLFGQYPFLEKYFWTEINKIKGMVGSL